MGPVTKYVFNTFPTTGSCPKLLTIPVNIEIDKTKQIENWYKEENRQIL